MNGIMDNKDDDALILLLLLEMPVVDNSPLLVAINELAPSPAISRLCERAK